MTTVLDRTKRAVRSIGARLPVRVKRAMPSSARSLAVRATTTGTGPTASTRTSPGSTAAAGVVCPICGAEADEFEPFGVREARPNRRCPGCKSLPRHRGVWLFFERSTDLFTQPVRMLHIAPEDCLAPRLAAHGNIDYLTADLASPTAMVKMDITDIQLPDGSFDVVYASHVLEHVPEDRTAMRELCRVLRPGGWAVLQVPIFGARTKDDPTVVDPQERERLYGQFNHVRMYGHDGEYERRLTEAGFDVQVHSLFDELGEPAARRFGLLPDEDIYFCRKPV